MLTETPKAASRVEVLDRLRSLCEERGLERLALDLGELSEVVQDDLLELEGELGELRGGERLSERAAAHLLAQGGKRLRPLCVLLAAHVGTGTSRRAIDLAVAAELVHNATLLHDDVVDLATERRGQAAARAEFGNAASIFAGDWLLIEALQRVRRAAVPGTLDRLLEVIAAMIRAESLQLECRGRTDTGRERYLEIADGKSATLFGWALHSGAAAGGLDEAACSALAEFGRHLGLAFQIVDDLLDLTGEPSATGKSLFTDLREGKMTFPLIVALERDDRSRSLRALLEELLQHVAVGQTPPLERCLDVQRHLHRSGAVAESRALAASAVARARACLEVLPACAATRALATVADATVHRRS
jgi:octaprenyl-diphosphate synthase